MTIYRGPGGAGDATNDAIVNEVASYATSAASSAANAATSATTASTASTSANTAATNAANSASAAATSATNAATSASGAASASTIATNKAEEAALSATQAANKASAASDSEANALNSANTAANKANDAANSATAAATSATSATAQASAAASSATAASNSATAAETSATNSATSASASAASATSAATQATNSATSATNSAASATTALGYLNTFKGQYYGNLSSNPTVDPLGNAIGQGDLYWNTTENTMKVFDGVSWIIVTTDANSAVKTQEFTATASQTTFTVTGGYLVGQIFVFKNGLKLASSAYTATDGSTFVLGSGATAGDILFALVFTKALISQPPFYSASSDEFTSATAYDQTVKMNINGKPYYMNNVAVAPTVDFKFDTTKNLQNAADGQVPATFTRASTGTYFDASGVMQSASSGLPRFTHDPANANASLGLLVEPQRTNLVLESAGFDKQNLLTYSQDLSNAIWASANVSKTLTQSDPTGGTSACLVAETTTNSSHSIGATYTVSANVPYIGSIYLKKGSGTSAPDVIQIMFGPSGFATGSYANFNLSTGTFGTTANLTTYGSTSLGNGWYRVWIGATATNSLSGGLYVVFTNNNDSLGRLPTYAGSTNANVFVFGAQMEVSYNTTPRQYTATTSSAYALWATTQTVVTPNSGITPDGTNSAFKIVAVSGQTLNNSANSARSGGFTTTVGSIYTTSAYAKASGYSVLNLRFSTSTTLSNQNGVCRFNLSTGSVISVSAGYNATITSVGNGWYRCSISCVASAATNYAGVWNDDTSATTANGTDGILLWGFQVEQADSASTYIPTTNAQVTRAADVMALANSGWLNQTEGTFYVDRKLRATTNNQTLFSLDNGTSDIKVRTIGGISSKNLILQSERFDDAQWTKINNGVFYGVLTAPDGTNTATKFVENTANGFHQIAYPSVNVGIGTYTFSVYISKTFVGTRNFALYPFNTSAAGGTATRGAIFDQTGTFVAFDGTGTDPTYSVQDVGSYYRVSVTGTSTIATVVGPTIRLLSGTSATYTGDNSSALYIWGAQFEVGSSATTYESNPILHNTTNILTYTESFDVASWTKTNVTVIANATVSPDGTLTADKLIATSTSGSHIVTAATTQTATTYTYSIYAKEGEYSQILLNNSATSNGAFFNLNSGTVGTVGSGITATISPVGNSWYRCSISYLSIAASVTTRCYVTTNETFSFAGDGSSGIYIWGAQLEASSSTSTYEPNPKYLTSYEIGSDGLIQTGNYAGYDAANVYQKSTFGYKANDATYYRGGSSVGTDSTVTLPTVMNRLVIGGSAINSGREINGTIKRLTYWPLKLTNTSQSTITS